MSSGRRIVIKGMKFKDGRLVDDVRRFDASKQRRIKSSKKVRVKRKGAP